MEGGPCTKFFIAPEPGLKLYYAKFNLYFNSIFKNINTELVQESNFLNRE